MKKRRSFSEYICSLYEPEISNEINDFCLRNTDIFNSKVLETITDVECDNISPKKIWIREISDLHLEFDMAVSAELALFEYTHRAEEEDSAEKWFLVKGLVDFADRNNGLILYGVEEYEPKYSAKTDYTDALIPFVEDEDTDRIADDIRKKYCYDGLSVTSQFDVGRLLSEMGLIAIEKQLSSDCTVFGQILFEDCNVEVFDSGKAEKEHFRAGTVLYDGRVFFLRNYGSLRHTLVHECVHWYLHRKTFLFAKYLREADCGIRCGIKGEMESDSSGEGWFMEWQANKIASKILVPTEYLIPKARELFAEERKAFPAASEASIMSMVVDDLSSVFGVSVQVIRIRLSECGVELAEGVFDYCDGRYLKPYSFKKHFLTANETFSIGCEDLIVETLKSPKLHSLLKESKLVYSDSHVCLNEPKYVLRTDDGAELTEYALAHMDECCIRFYIDTGVKKSGRGFYRECILCHDLNKGVKFNCTFEGEANKNLVAQADAIISQKTAENEYLNCISRVCFKDTLNALMSYKNLSEEGLRQRTKIGERQIIRLRKGETDKPSVETLVAIAVGLKLPESVARALLSSCGCDLIPGKTLHMLYSFFISDSCYKTVVECNEMLISKGYKPLVKDKDEE